MTAAVRQFDRQFFWPILVLGAALLCGFQVGQLTASDDDYDVTDEKVENTIQERVIVRVARAEPGFAMSRFNQTLFGGLDGSSDGRVRQILHDRLLALEMVSGVSKGVMQKLELAGRGDIKRLADRIDELRKEYQLIDARGERQIPVDLAHRANELRACLELGPFDQYSMFASTLRQFLDADQQVLYNSFRELGIRGGKVQLRECGRREIKVIRMTNAALTDEGLVHFTRLNRLKGVLLDYTQVTDEGLAHLAGLTGLELLDLGSTQVRGPGLVHVADMRRLKILDLRRTPVTDAALIHLRNLADMRTLNLGHTHVTGTGFTHLAGLANLESIQLHQTPFVDEGLAHLENLPKLKTLVLEGTQITDAGLVSLSRIASLETLNLRRTGTTDKGLSHLAGLSNLQLLDVYDTDVTATAIDELKKALPRLTVVK